MVMFMPQEFFPTEPSPSHQHKVLTTIFVLFPYRVHSHPGNLGSLPGTAPQKVTTYMGLPRARGEPASSSSSSWGPEAGPIVED